MTDVERNELVELIALTGLGSEPEIRLVSRAGDPGRRLGVFSSSFNPLTVAHIEVMRAAADAVGLDELVALAGKTNADKSSYECPLESRIEMLMAGLSYTANMSIGISSSAFFVDKVDAFARVYPPSTRLHFIVGFDTFERIIDVGQRYTASYHRRFAGREEALRHLLSACRLIVAPRLDKGFEEFQSLAARAPSGLEDRCVYLDLAPELRRRSSSEVRRRLAAGEPVTGLVPAAVERYIEEHRLYRLESA